MRTLDRRMMSTDGSLGAAGDVSPFSIDGLLSQFTALPPKGTPAADLTERDKVAIAIAAGVTVETVMDGMILTVRTTVPVGVADRGDGGYLVAIGKTQEPSHSSEQSES